jgi:general secretion pathway protein B
MSFILDALKKSEQERARQAGPALMEMRIARPRRRVVPWIATLAALLAVNLAVLLWFLLRREPPPSAAAATATAPARPAASAPVAAVVSAAAEPSSGTSPAALATPPPRASGALPPPAAFVADPGARVAGEEQTGEAASDNPADFEPAASPSGGSVRVAPTGARQNYKELGGDVPELRLDLHVYASRPQDRYALINMHKVHEGDTLPEGPHVVEITRDGVVLDWQGSEFLLGRE